LSDVEVAADRDRRPQSRQPGTAQAAYLINLASRKEDILEKSVNGLADELTRAARLGLDGLVLHPGGHLGAGVEVGIDLVARSLDAGLAQPATGDAKVLLEHPAGQGTALGAGVGEL